MTIDFVNPRVNNAAQKPLTQVNWNEFVRELKSSTLYLPACYGWIHEYDLEPNEFLTDLIADLALYLSSGEALGALVYSPLIMLAISACTLTEMSIAFVLEKCFEMKNSVDNV